MNVIRMRNYHEIRVYLFWALIITCVIYLLKVTFTKEPTEVVIVREETQKQPETVEHKEFQEKATHDNQVGDEYNNDDLRRQILPPDTEFDQIKQHLENVKKEIEHFSKDHKESKHKPEGMGKHAKVPEVLAAFRDHGEYQEHELGVNDVNDAMETLTSMLRLMDVLGDFAPDNGDRKMKMNEF